MSKKIDHSKRAHALLSASGASRWMTCTPSARFEENFPPQSSSVYAEEGTLAHEFGDLMLQLRSGIMAKSEYQKQVEVLRKHKLYTDEMEEQVSKYVDYFIELFLDLVKANQDPIISIEEKFDLRDFIEDGFGTNDVSIIAGDTLWVGDLKYGKGIIVVAEDNPQLKLYGIGALKKIGKRASKIKNIILVIVQPRLDSVSEFRISKDDLVNWAVTEVKHKAQMAYAGEGDFVAGDHCKYCRAKVKCKAIFDFSIETAKLDFSEDPIPKNLPNTISDEDLLKIHRHNKLISDWLKEVSNHLVDRAIKGEKFEGYKLVEGSPRRMIIEPEQAEIILDEFGYSKDLTHNIKLKGIGDLEKLLKSKFNPILKPYIGTTKPGPSLVQSKVNRKEFKQPTAKDDFS